MLGQLTDRLVAAAERRLRAFSLDVLVMALGALFAAISLGFGTYAAYTYLQTLDGRLFAALVVCAAYGLLAILVLAIGVARRRAAKSTRLTAVALPVSPRDVDTLADSLAVENRQGDQELFDAAARLGRELSTLQLVAIALIGGVVAGRKLLKKSSRGQ